MLKKTLIFVVIVGVLISMTILPVSAADFYYEEFCDFHVLDLDISKVTNNDGITVSSVLPLNCYTEWFMASDWVDGSLPTVYDEFVSFDFAEYGDNLTWYNECSWEGSVWSNIYNPLAGRIWLLGAYGSGVANVIDVTDFKDGSSFDLSFTYAFNGLLDEGSAPAGPQINLSFVARWFEEGYLEFTEETLIYTDKGGWQEFDGSGTVTFTVPPGKRYCQIGCIVEGLRADTYFEIYFDNPIITANISAFEANSKMMDKIIKQIEIQNGKLDNIESGIDELPGEIGDEIKDIIDKENQSASDAGDSAAGDLIDLIPNESQGFINAIQNLVSSMSYNGVVAELPIPAITLPAIDGVMPQIKLTDELSVDFDFWIEKIPADILQLVRILCTIALIVYCFKELYGTISYALTLKGGGSNE